MFITGGKDELTSGPDVRRIVEVQHQREYAFFVALLIQIAADVVDFRLH